MDKIGYYFVVPLLLAIVYLGGAISGRSRHSRTLYQWMSGFFLVLTAVYLAPMGVVSVWLSLAALVGALAVGLLLRRAIGSERLLPGKELMRSQYPVLFYLLPIVLGSLIGMGRTSRLSPIALRTILIATPMLCVIVERISYHLHKGHRPADEERL